jgi:hypothetical protein
MVDELSISTFKNGTLESFDNLGIPFDRLRISIPKFNVHGKYREPNTIKLLATSREKILGLQVEDFAYHLDVNSNRKFKSVGTIRQLSLKNWVANFTNIIGGLPTVQ